MLPLVRRAFCTTPSATASPRDNKPQCSQHSLLKTTAGNSHTYTMLCLHQVLIRLYIHTSLSDHQANQYCTLRRECTRCQYGNRLDVMKQRKSRVCISLHPAATMLDQYRCHQCFAHTQTARFCCRLPTRWRSSDNPCLSLKLLHASSMCRICRWLGLLVQINNSTLLNAAFYGENVSGGGQTPVTVSGLLSITLRAADGAPANSIPFNSMHALLPLSPNYNTSQPLFCVAVRPSIF